MNEEKIITILGVKPGTGQTLISSNTVISLARKLQGKEKKPPILIDLTGKQTPDSEILLQIKEPKSISDITGVIPHIDKELLKSYLKIFPPGINYLKSKNNEILRTLSPEDLKKFILLFKETNSFIIADTDKNFLFDNNYFDSLITVLDCSNLVLLVLTPDLLSFNSAKNIIEKLTSLHYPLNIVKLVLNMKGMPAGLSRENFEKLLNFKIPFEIPYDIETVMSSINCGNLPVILHPRSSFSTAIISMCEKFIEDKTIFTDVLPQRNYRKTQHPAENSHKYKTDSETSYTDKALSDEKIINLKNTLHKKLLTEIDLKSVPATASEEKKKELRQTTKQVLERLLAKEITDGFLSRDHRTLLINEMLDEVLGLGPLEIFLRDPSITEIMVTGKDKIYIEQSGKIKLTGMRFNSDEQIYTVIERIVSPLGRRVDESSPLCDARLSDGSRVNIVIPPLVLDGPAITIRKFSEKKLSPHDLIKFGSLTEDMVKFLSLCVRLRKNIVVSGGTGSGKTTLLNILSSFIPEDERIITIEDSAELKLQQPHVVRLESRPANSEGQGEIPIRKLVINALRMRPDRIIVGECRGGEALDMLQAMNTGHSGSLTTVHANSPRDALNRIETMFLMAGIEFPVRAIREQIKSAINIIVQQSRMSDGTRKITSISEVTGMEGDIITMQDIFCFRQTGVSSDGKVEGNYQSTGIVPTFIEEIKAKGIEFDISVFSKK